MIGKIPVRKNPCKEKISNFREISPKIAIFPFRWSCMVRLWFGDFFIWFGDFLTQFGDFWTESSLSGIPDPSFDTFLRTVSLWGEKWDTDVLVVKNETGILSIVTRKATLTPKWFFSFLGKGPLANKNKNRLKFNSTLLLSSSFSLLFLFLFHSLSLFCSLSFTLSLSLSFSLV